MAHRYRHIIQININVSKLLSISTFGLLKENLKTPSILGINI